MFSYGGGMKPPLPRRRSGRRGSFLPGGIVVNLLWRGGQERTDRAGRHDVPLGLVQLERLAEDAGRLIRSFEQPQRLGEVDERVGLHVEAVRLEREVDRFARESLGN